MYTREEVAWIIREAWDAWPPKTTGYIDTHEDVQNGTPRGMPGQAEIEVIAEVKSRVSAAGEAGEVLLDEIQGKAFDTVDLSRYSYFQIYLSRSAKAALNYISGPKRRRIPFMEWKWRKKTKPWRKRCY